MKKSRITITLMLFALFLAYTCACLLVDVSGYELKILNEGNTTTHYTTDIGFQWLNRKVNLALGYHEIFYKLSEYLGYFALLTGFAIGCLWLYQLIRKRSFWAVDSVLSASVITMALMALFYVLFEVVELNYRPVILDESGLEASYPSSHTLLGFTVFGCAALVGKYLTNDKKFNRLLIWLFFTLATVTALFRALSGVHWISDIVGGLLLSSALLYFAVYALNLIDDRKSIAEE